MTTKKASRSLGCTTWQIRGLVRDGKIPKPRKEEGRLDWSPEDLERARVALAALKGTGPKPRREEAAHA